MLLVALIAEADKMDKEDQSSTRVSGVSRVSKVSGAIIKRMRDKSQKGYHKTIVWEKLRDLVLIVYKLTEKLPKSEELGLKSQMRRAVVSGISNFVEGYLKRSIKEKQHFMEISQTSLQELEAQAEVCMILGYWTEDDYEAFDQKHRIACYFLLKYKEKVK